jgi:hypothetical protein
MTYTLTVHVRDFLDLQSTLQTSGVCLISLTPQRRQKTYTGNLDP